MGRAIVRDVKLLLMDEPLSNLDAKLRVQMRAEITKIHKRIGATTIYVTHDQTEAMTLADRIVIIDYGDIKQVGTPRELYNEPQNLFVATFIGSPAMNIFKVKYENQTISLGSDFSLSVPAGQAKVLDAQGYNGKEVYFGIRPEDLHAERVALDTYPDAILKADVTFSELMGADSMLYAKVGDNELVARVNARDYLEPGQVVTLAAEMSKVHFFDATTEDRIH